MKYSVLLALLGSATAIQHHHHHRHGFVQLVDPNTPDANRQSYEDHKKIAAEVVEKQGTTEKTRTANLKEDNDGICKAVEENKSKIEAQRYRAMKGGVSDVQITEPNTPDSNRQSFEDHKKIAAEVVEKQGTTEKTRTANLKEDNDGICKAVEENKSKIEAQRYRAMKGGVSDVQISGPLIYGEQDATLQPGKEAATKITSQQAIDEQKKTKEIEKLNDEAIKKTKADRESVSKSRSRQMIGGVSDVQLEDVSLGASDEQFKIGKAEAANVTATQEKFQAEHNAMVKNNNDADVTSANTKKWQVSAARANMMNGGVNPHPSVKEPAQVPLTAHEFPASLLQVQDNEANKSFVPAKEQASLVTSTQQAFEAKKFTDFTSKSAEVFEATNAVKDGVAERTEKSMWEFQS